MKNTFINKAQASILIRIPETEKNEAVRILDKLGISLTQSFYMFVRALINTQGIPFDVKIDDKLNKKIEKIRFLEKMWANYDPKSLEGFDIQTEEQLQEYITAQRRK